MKKQSTRQVNSSHPQAVPAIVIGLDCMTGLQTARVLAARHIPVIGIASDPSHPCCRTWVCQQILYADTGSEDFIHTLETLGPTLRQQAVLFPCTDMSVLTISQNRQRLTEWYHMALPVHETIEMLMDKVRFYTYAAEAGLPIPTTFFLRSRADVEKAAAHLTYPCILKPPFKTPTWEQNTKAKVYKAESAEELLELYNRCSAWADVLMVQDWIAGPDTNLYSCNCYFDGNSEPLVTYVTRKLRQWPLETGTGCLGVEERNDVVLQGSLQLFKSVNYHGLGYVEMKRDENSGEHFIIEPNVGRPTGRSAMAESGGVEILYTKYCDLLGLPLPANREQSYGGLKWVYLRRDLQAAFATWRKGDLTLKEWWQSLQGKKCYAAFSWRDPVPFFSDFAKAFNKFGGRRSPADVRTAPAMSPPPTRLAERGQSDL